MDATTVIETNRQALLRIVATLVAMAGWASIELDRVAGPAATLPRQVRTAILRLLRPAESAARRLAIALAAQLPPLDPAPVRRRQVAPPPPEYIEVHQSLVVRPGQAHRMTGIVLPAGTLRRMGPDGSPQAFLAPRPTLPPPPRPRASPRSRRAPRASFPLLDPLRTPFGARRKVSPSSRPQPRIWSLNMTTAPHFAAPRQISPDDRLDAGALARRIALLAAALDDLPAQARRHQRWRMARAAAQADNKRRLEDAEQRRRAAPPGIDIGAPRLRSGRASPLKPGRPPGGRLARWDPDARRLKRIREVDEILAHAHALALYALEPRDTS